MWLQHIEIIHHASTYTTQQWNQQHSMGCVTSAESESLSRAKAGVSLFSLSAYITQLGCSCLWQSHLCQVSHSSVSRYGVSSVPAVLGYSPSPPVASESPWDPGMSSVFAWNPGSLEAVQNTAVTGTLMLLPQAQTLVRFWTKWHIKKTRPWF